MINFFPFGFIWNCEHFWETLKNIIDRKTKINSPKDFVFENVLIIKSFTRVWEILWLVFQYRSCFPSTCYRAFGTENINKLGNAFK